MEKYAVIVAGGSGTRMNGPLPKQFLLLKNKPVLWYTISAFLDAFEDIHILLVLPEEHFEKGNEIARLFPTADHRITLVAGGATRFHSVRNGLLKVPADAIVFVHDGVRCLLSSGLVQRCCEHALLHGNAIPAIEAVDSIRVITEGGNQIVDRSRVRIIQTPQTFKSSLIKKAFEAPYEVSFTDEASVWETAGWPVHLIEGEAFNMKITHPIDLVIARQILEERKV